MCKLVNLNCGSKSIKVASIKKEHINNIIANANKCSHIDKILLFGSATQSRCKETSDIDIAIFGDIAKSRLYKLKSYNDFVKSIYSFDYNQDYDVLYFKTDTNSKLPIMNDINNGEVLYERA